MLKKTISIVLADDHCIFREGLKTVLKPIKHIKLVGDVKNGAELIDIVKKLQPDVVITDIMMPEVDGLEATMQLCKEVPGVRIIALSMFGQESLVVDMLDAGAIGYLLKNATREELVTAIETVERGKPYFCKEVSDRLTQLVSRNQTSSYKPVAGFQLNEREKEIMRLICQEFSSKEIGGRFGISKRTVEGYRVRIMDKIGAKSIAGIITYAVTRGIYIIEKG
jgi:DNA-binding NarL/FixJ family response regulator